MKWDAAKTQQLWHTTNVNQKAETEEPQMACRRFSERTIPASRCFPSLVVRKVETIFRGLNHPIESNCLGIPSQFRSLIIL